VANLNIGAAHDKPNFRCPGTTNRPGLHGTDVQADAFKAADALAYFSYFEIIKVCSVVLVR
jgi:hypothetical protein